MTPDLRRDLARVDFLPLCYQDIAIAIRQRKPSAMLFMCSPPDTEGRCSFGAEVGFMPDLWRDVPIRIAHINPRMPSTPGDPGIPFNQITAFMDGEQALVTLPSAVEDPVTQAIARHVAGFVGDGATLQTGLGKLPDAVLRTLQDRHALSFHTGLIGDGVLDLIESGAVARPGCVVAGVAIGSEKLYRSLTDPVFQFRPVSVTHGAAHLATIPNLVTINSRSRSISSAKPMPNLHTPA